MAPEHPEWKDKQPFKALIEGDKKTLAAAGKEGLMQVMAVTHAGMTIDEFTKAVIDWTETARHPRFNRLYTELVLPADAANCWPISAPTGSRPSSYPAAAIEFMRPWTERVYGIPPEQVVGSSGVVEFQIGIDGKPELLKLAKIEFVDDGPGKPVGINRFIGRRPIFAFGNSDGDLQMLQWTVGGQGPHFAGLVHHTDAEREYAYDRESKVGKLDKAWDEAKAKGWTVVDMKQDWKTVFPDKH